MIKLQYTPQAGPFGDLPDVQEITMTLSDSASFEGASREFCTFLMASGYRPPQGWDSAEEREWEWITNEDYEVGEIYSDEFLAGVDWAEAKLKEKNT